MAKDLRSFIDKIEEEAPEQLGIVDREVDPEFEIASIVRAFQEDGTRGRQLDDYPMILANDVEGHPDWRVVTNVLGTRARISQALAVSQDELLDEYIERRENPLEPVEVSDGPVKDVVRTGDDVDLYDLPLLMHTPAEPAPFIDGEVLVCYDDENERYNAGIYRMMRKNEQQAGVFFARGTHAHSILQQHEARDEPMEFAAYVGHHPAAVFGSQVHTVEDEYEAIGGVLGEPLELVDCETVDLKVPANAELVVEGRIEPHVREREGPFCEFTYLLGKERESPVANVTAITHREDPIYYDVYNPYTDHTNHGALPMEADVYRKAKDAVSQVQDVFIPAECSKFVAIVQVRKEYEGVGKQAGIAAASGKYFMKNVITVDEDQDPRDLADVWWAISMKTRPDRDINIMTDAYIEDLDPMGTDGRGWPHIGGGVDSRVFIDATKPLDVDYPPYCEPPEEMWQEMDVDEFVTHPQ